MKKILCLAVALWFFGATSQLSAQDVQSVMNRYEERSGFNRVDPGKTAVMSRLSVNAMGMQIPCTVITAPQGRVRVEMTANGQTILMIVNGQQGWMSVPGMGVQTIPQEQLPQMIDQYDVISGLKWNSEDYDLELLDPVQQGGIEYQVVRAVPKAEDDPTEQMDIYFDTLTGMPAFAEAQVEVNGQKMAVKTLLQDYKTSAGMKYPSQIKTEVGGNTVSSVSIDTLAVDYPVNDAMFARPQ